MSDWEEDEQPGTRALANNVGVPGAYSGERDSFGIPCPLCGSVRQPVAPSEAGQITPFDLSNVGTGIETGNPFGNGPPFGN